MLVDHGTESKYFDPKATTDNPRWCMVDVRAIKRYTDVIALTTLKQIDELADMNLLRRGNRLSVMPVSANEWRIIRKMAG